MTAVGVVAALAAEARALGRGRPLPDGLIALPDGTLVAQSGIGFAAAAAAAARLAGAGAGGLVSWGTAGGLDPRLATGSLVIPSAVVGVGGGSFAVAASWHERLTSAAAMHCAVTAGRLLSVSTALDTADAKARAYAATGAAAVDMESYAIAEYAAAHRLPFVVVRVVVDTAADRVPRAVAAASRGGQIRLGRLLMGLAAAPSEIAALMGLARRYRIATAVLGTLAAVAPPAGSFS